MTENQPTLRRQAAWQRSRRALSWPEKIRMVEALRDSILLLRRSAPPRRGQTDSPAGDERSGSVD